MVALPALAAQDMFLKLDGIKGESADSRHAGEIDVLTWNWGAAQATATGNKLAGTGRAAVNALVLTKFIDVSSPRLFESVMQGKHITEAVLVVRKAGAKPLEFIRIRLREVLVVSIKTSGNVNDRPTEEVSLQFSSAEYSYSPQKADGSAGPAITYTWTAGK
jgi:type VI secretion system secreted protein Hcp